MVFGASEENGIILSLLDFEQIEKNNPKESEYKNITSLSNMSSVRWHSLYKWHGPAVWLPGTRQVTHPTTGNPGPWSLKPVCMTESAWNSCSLYVLCSQENKGTLFYSFQIKQSDRSSHLPWDRVDEEVKEGHMEGIKKREDVSF